MTGLRDALMLWDFDHSRKRQRVWVGRIWQVECRCGEIFQTMQAWEDHRYDRAVDLFGGAE